MFQNYGLSATDQCLSISIWATTSCSDMHVSHKLPTIWFMSQKGAETMFVFFEATQ